MKLLLIPVLLYLAIVAAFYFGQTSLIFPARMVAGAGPLPAGAIRLELATFDGHKLHGVHIPPRLAGAGPVVLGFSGNAWNSEDAASFLSSLYPAADVILFHYRGYRPSTGSPGAAALLSDALAIHDFVDERFGGRPIVAVGFSIGSGIAAHLAGRRPLAGAILVTPFDSLAAVARDKYPWLPVGPLLRHRMNPAESMRGSRVPTAIIVAGRDSLIPPRRAAALAEGIPNLVFSRTVAEAGHNDVYEHPSFRAHMAEAMKRIVAAHPKS